MKKTRLPAPQKLRQQVDEYFERCIAADAFPDLAGMRLCLGLSEAELRTLLNEESRHAEEYRRIFETAKDRRESWLVRAMTSDNKRTSGCMNALKQKENGGYAEKTDGEHTLHINVIGIPGGMNAFR